MVTHRRSMRAFLVTRFAPVMSDDVEREFTDAFHWWPIAELAALEESVSPLALAEILASYLRNGAPAEPPDEEVIVD